MNFFPAAYGSSSSKNKAAVLLDCFEVRFVSLHSCGSRPSSRGLECFGRIGHVHPVFRARAYNGVHGKRRGYWSWVLFRLRAGSGPPGPIALEYSVCSRLRYSWVQGMAARTFVNETAAVQQFGHWTLDARSILAFEQHNPRHRR